MRGRTGDSGALDQAALRALHEQLQRDLQLLRQETETAFAALSDARRQLSEVGGDDAVARIEAERANLLEALGADARAYLSDRLGLLALEQGLRRYRDQHRSGMLARASDAFSRLTQGRYQGLSAQPDGRNEVLIAQMAEGGAKLAAAMSKGTRFQLYLALRIAGYHELAQTRPSVPFIADDIMETFDDARAAQAFGLLAEMAQVGQVIYLTHHRHLCDIAQSVAPGVQITDLTALR